MTTPTLPTPPTPPTAPHYQIQQYTPGLLAIVWCQDGAAPMVMTTILAARLPLLGEAIVNYIAENPGILEATEKVPPQRVRVGSQSTGARFVANDDGEEGQ
jgi:hypothetical protein